MKRYLSKDKSKRKWLRRRVGAWKRGDIDWVFIKLPIS